MDWLNWFLILIIVNDLFVILKGCMIFLFCLYDVKYACAKGFSPNFASNFWVNSSGLMNFYPPPYRGNRSWLIRLNLLNIKRKIWRWSLSRSVTTSIMVSVYLERMPRWVSAFIQNRKVESSNPTDARDQALGVQPCYEGYIGIHSQGTIPIPVLCFCIFQFPTEKWDDHPLSTTVFSQFHILCYISTP